VDTGFCPKCNYIRNLPEKCNLWKCTYIWTNWKTILKVVIVMCTPEILIPRRLRQEDHEFEASLSYLGSSRPAGLHSEILSQQWNKTEQKNPFLLGMAVLACNLSTWEAEAGGLPVPGQDHSETLSYILRCWIKKQKQKPKTRKDPVTTKEPPNQSSYIFKQSQ
jgi:hypothetical protein